MLTVSQGIHIHLPEAGLENSKESPRQLTAGIERHFGSQWEESILGYRRITGCNGRMLSYIELNPALITWAEAMKMRRWHSL